MRCSVTRYDRDDDYRWALHRWIAIGNEALAYAEAGGLDPRRDEPWARVYLQRNALAHRRLPDIDEDGVWRHTMLRADQYQATCEPCLRDVLTCRASRRPSTGRDQS